MTLTQRPHPQPLKAAQLCCFITLRNHLYYWTHPNLQPTTTDMDARLLVFIVIACAMTGIQGQTVTSLSSNITRSGCGNSTGGKLCFNDCNPSNNTNCTFGSSQSQANSTTLFFELSGPGGFVALGLTTNQSQGIPYVYLCINATSINCSDSTNNLNCSNIGSFVFKTGSTNTSNFLSFANTTTVTTVQGNVSSGYIQCTFSTPNNLTTSRASNTSYFVSLFSGSTIANAVNMSISSVFTSTKALDLTDPTSNTASNSTNTTTTTTTTAATTSSHTNGSVGPVAQALVILLSAMGLLALY